MRANGRQETVARRYGGICRSRSISSVPVSEGLALLVPPCSLVRSICGVVGVDLHPAESRESFQRLRYFVESASNIVDAVNPPASIAGKALDFQVALKGVDTAVQASIRYAYLKNRSCAVAEKIGPATKVKFQDFMWAQEPKIAKRL